MFALRIIWGDEASNYGIPWVEPNIYIHILTKKYIFSSIQYVMDEDTKCAYILINLKYTNMCTVTRQRVFITLEEKE